MKGYPELINACKAGVEAHLTGPLRQFAISMWKEQQEGRDLEAAQSNIGQSF